jgi:ribosomal protein S10
MNASTPQWQCRVYTRAIGIKPAQERLANRLVITTELRNPSQFPENGI